MQIRAAIAAPVLIALGLSGCGHPAAAPEPAATTASVAGESAPDPRIGALFVGGTDIHTCSGSVLHSTSGDLVLTAAHCLADGVAADFVPAFAPVLSGDADAHWRVDAVYLDPRWVADQDPRADFAIVRVRRDSAPSSSSIESQVGALHLGTMPPLGAAITVTGYPWGDGGPVKCRGVANVHEGFPSVACAGMVDGTSGAPWVVGTTVTGVTGGFDGGGCEDDVSYSAPFGEAVAHLLARAQAGGPGDVAPVAYFTDC